MIAADTNIISALLRGEAADLPDEELYIPYVVVAELLSGVAAGNNPQKNKILLDSFLEDKNVTTSPGLVSDLLPFYAQIYTYLRKNGTPISPNDLWIAAECMYLSMPLLTRDKDFSNVPQILLVQPEIS
jgi:predicted nucleic acid-binding protein